MFKKMRKKYGHWQEGLIATESLNQSLQSYLGALKHCNGYGIMKKIREMVEC